MNYMTNTLKILLGSAICLCTLFASAADPPAFVPLPSAAEPASGLSDVEIEQFRQNAAARCRAEFESGKPFVSREIKKDWNNRGDFTRYYVQDVIYFATRALRLGEQIDDANLASQTTTNQNE